MSKSLFKYILRIADNSLIHGQRLSEWCGHGPILEEDIALSNIALDYIGQARFLLTYAGKVEGEGRTEDDLAFLRYEKDYFNCLLVEQPNGDYAVTITKLLFLSMFNYVFYSELQKSKDEQLSAIAQKSLKEVKYHLRHSREWMLRFGNGTDESNRRATNAINELWMFVGEMFEADSIDQEMLAEGIGVDLDKIKPIWYNEITQILEEANLSIPTDNWSQTGGKIGKHTEYLGFMLAEMQHMQRMYPNVEW